MMKMMKYEILMISLLIMMNKMMIFTVSTAHNQAIAHEDTNQGVDVVVSPPEAAECSPPR